MQALYPTPRPLPEAADARPLAWWTPAQLDAVASPAAQAWSAWLRDWVGGAHTGAVTSECAQAHERPERQASVWVPLGRRGGAAAWIDTRGGPEADVLDEIFGADAGGGARQHGQEGIAHSVAARAWAALAENLRGALALDAAEDALGPDALCFKPWSGAVLVSARYSGRLPRTLLLNAECVRALLASQGDDPAATRRPPAPRETMVPLAQALAARKLPIRIELSPCELDLGSLQGLRVGDIIPLSHSLDAPLFVSTAQDVPVCGGFLGRQAGFKAIELVREAHADHHP